MTRTECGVEITAALAAFREACEACTCPNKDKCECEEVGVRGALLDGLLETYGHIPLQQRRP